MISALRSLRPWKKKRTYIINNKQNKNELMGERKVYGTDSKSLRWWWEHRQAKWPAYSEQTRLDLSLGKREHLCYMLSLNRGAL